MSIKGRLNAAVILFCLFFSFGCSERERPADGNRTTVIFKHGKISGDPAIFRAILDRFESENPAISVRDESLPASTDEQHQFYTLNMEGGSPDFDVLSMDVIWVPEFARAGWIRDLSHLVPDRERSDFFPGPMEAVTYEGRQYALPWYIDAGVLYYRKDLLEKYGFPPPRTWDGLVRAAQHIASREKDLYGYIWQGKQYEGLVCNVLEIFWSNGGDVLRDGRLVLDSRENREAAAFLRNLIELGVTPPLVTTAMEEATRHIFGNGRALFMRNWPYVWNIVNAKGSAVRGKVGVAPLPSFPGKDSASALGGWQLGVNRFSRKVEAAEKLVRYLCSPDVQKHAALEIGYRPTRRSVYDDREMRERDPFIASLHDIFMKSRPRPVSPYYMMMTQVMQPEFSAVISGIRSPEEALSSAQRQIGHILGADR
ncbi:MAG: ABC transporter substrate-binding protein [Desulfobacteraceae bacterium]|nr:MAG: ABC transporter substrate-binding protein [Desulfobacteraceae bacterium]